MRNARFRCTGIARYDALSGGTSGAMRWRVFITGFVLATTGGPGFCQCRLCRAVHARSAARRRYGSSRQPRSCGLQAPSRAGGRCCRECRGRMRDRGLCKAHVDAVAAAPREHDARRVPGRRICGIRQWPPVLGDGDRRQQSCQYPSAWRHSHSGRPQRQGPRWHCRPGLLHRWKQRAVSYLRTIELSGR